ncbi:MAG: carboxypeptidase-like regulatory domain-containing protein [Gemmatimonadaceae bacterium]
MQHLVTMALATAMVAVFAGAQDAVPTRIYGTVRNTSGVAVVGAEVWIDGTGHRTVSNDSGEFQIDRAPTGRVKVMVRRIGFRPDSKRIALQPGDARQVQFVLEGLLEELEAVLVTAQAQDGGRMQEFWARRMVGLGVFMTREEIERSHPSRTVDLFRGIVGVRVISNNSGMTRLVSGRHSTPSMRGHPSAAGACAMQFYVDGVSISPGSFSVDEVPPETLEAIEVYRGPSEIPTRFSQRDTACGLVVIWTREPPPRVKKEPTERGKS